MIGFVGLIGLAAMYFSKEHADISPIGGGVAMIAPRAQAPRAEAATTIQLPSIPKPTANGAAVSQEAAGQAASQAVVEQAAAHEPPTNEAVANQTATREAPRLRPDVATSRAASPSAEVASGVVTRAERVSVAATLKGLVTARDTDSLVLSNIGGEARSIRFVLTPQTQFSVEPKVGDARSVTYREDGDRKIAIRVF